MEYKIDGIDYEVIITKKNNKNTYIRVKEDLKIYVTTNYFVTKRQIIDLLNSNINYLKRSILEQRKRKEKKSKFFYLGRSYDIIEVSIMKDIEIDAEHSIIYTKDRKMVDRWLKKEIIRIFNDRYERDFNKFAECHICPQLKIRHMKSRWGVYNRQNHSITLNAHLIEYEIDKLDYVIYHELSHTEHFDHSKQFWALVSKYCPNYKKIKKDLKE